MSTHPLVQWLADTDVELSNAVPYNAPALVGEICQVFLTTDLSLSEVCENKLVEGGPPHAVLMLWAQHDERIRSLLSAVRKAKAEATWDRTERDIHDIFDSEEDSKRAVGKAKLLYDYRRVQVEKLLPETYGAGLRNTAPPEVSGGSYVVNVPEKEPERGGGEE